MKKATEIFSFLIFSFLVSCKKEVRNVVDIRPLDSSHISITNISPSISNLQLYLNNKPLLLPDSPLVYGKTVLATYIYNPGSSFPDTLSLPFINITPGYQQLSFGSFGNNNSFGNLNNNFEAGATYSLFLTDTVVHGKITSVLLKDNVTNTDTTKSLIRFLNLSPDTPPLDVIAYPDAGYNGYKLFTNCAYIPGDYHSFVNGESFSEIDRGIYYFEATIAGTTNVLLGGYLIIPGEQVITIYTKGYFSATGANALDVGVIQYQHKTN
jgi:hypothetical protein